MKTSAVLNLEVDQKPKAITRFEIWWEHGGDRISRAIKSRDAGQIRSDNAGENRHYDVTI